jgi:hypothetical protein
MVVDAVDARVLERDPPPLGLGVIARRLEHLGDGVAPVQRHHFLPQRIVGGVERDGERDRQGEVAQPVDAGHDTDGRHGEVTAREPGVVVEAGQRFEHRVDVREGLAHAHVDHIRDALFGRVLRAEHLLADLAGVEVAIEAGLAGRAERAAHRTPRLRGHAHRRAVAVAHEHCFHLRAALGTPQPFERDVVGAALLGGEFKRGRQRAVEVGAQGLREVRQRVEWTALRPEPVEELVGPVPGFAARRKEIVDLFARGEVARRHAPSTSRS